MNGYRTIPSPTRRVPTAIHPRLFAGGGAGTRQTRFTSLLHRARSSLDQRHNSTGHSGCAARRPIGPWNGNKPCATPNRRNPNFLTAHPWATRKRTKIHCRNGSATHCRDGSATHCRDGSATHCRTDRASLSEPCTCDGIRPVWSLWRGERHGRNSLSYRSRRFRQLSRWRDWFRPVGVWPSRCAPAATRP